MKSRSTFVAAALIASYFATPTFADEQADELARLQGTWKQVEYESKGNRTKPRLEKTWTFDRKALSTQMGSLPPIVFDVELKADARPKELNLKMRGAGAQAKLERGCYRFVGDVLEIVQSQDLSVAPKSFDTKSDSTLTIHILKKTGATESLPQEEVISHSKNAEAEAALLKFEAAIMKQESLKSIEPYVAGRMARTLWEQLPKPFGSPEAIDAELKSTGVRDVQVGERIYYANGTEKIVTAEDLTDNKTLLKLVQGQREQGFFWVVREQKSWKVDVTNLIGLLRTPGPALFRGIRAGMPLSQAKKLLKDYHSSGAYKSLKIIDESETKLKVSLIENGFQTVLVFEAADGKVTNVVNTVGMKLK